MADTALALETTTLVDLLVWTYQRQRADVMSGRGLWGPEAEVMDEEPFHQISGDGCAKIAATAAYGCDIDGGGYQRAALHPDAEAVHDAVVALSADNWIGAQLVRRYAKQGATPHWDVRQHLEPVYVGGKPEVRDGDAYTVRYRRELRVVSARYCPVEPYPANAWVEMMRGEYRAWYSGLAAVARMLERAALTRWSIVGIGAEREPWR